ncbi:hypothetical protein LRS74_03415 [Streptomyces sp. LX-29]|uniref:hypothetical protein n=1 Tax=Streptomyces sp. LX-29 TaxID=2900152 RepID=UPI00240D4C51|nr:hypothetical protein [Streptomyces sp. LX-29]WFB06198.1 hypothetical protein LRS74_03415 [Streptomyces sp. LX-29]
MEIERKFLLAAPPDPGHPVLSAARRVQLEQIYLSVGPAGEERIRHWRCGGTERFFHTLLTPLRPGVRTIDEREIGPEAYARLRRRGDPCRQPVVKERWLFDWRGRLFELDIIHEPATRACRILEVQLDKERQQVALPEFLLIDREVTGHPAFSNADIARG